MLKNKTKFRELGDCGLKTLAAVLLNQQLPTYGQVTNAKRTLGVGRHFDDLDISDNETVRYACADSDFALRLHRFLNDWFAKYIPAHRVIAELVESPTAVFTGMMKHNGLPVDVSLMREQEAKAAAALTDLREKIAFIIGDINLGKNASNEAFKDYLFTDLGLPVFKKGEDDKPT